MPESTVLCPLVTPFSDTSIDVDTLASLVKQISEAGIDGMVPCGTTGEFASLSPNERQSVIETTVEASSKDTIVIAGAAATATATAIDRIRDAAQANADAVLLPPPYFHTANVSRGLEEFFLTVADESPLPVYLYDIPSCTGQQIPIEVITSIASHADIVGLKDSSGDFEHFASIIHRAPDNFEVFQGFETQLVQSVLSGANGGICGLTNAIPNAFRNLVDFLDAGKYERAIDIQSMLLNPLFSQGLDAGLAPVCKTAAEVTGLIPNATVRPPLSELNDSSRAKIKATIEETTKELDIQTAGN